MGTVYTSAPGKAILFGEHGVNRGKAALAAAVQQRTYCRIETRTDRGYRLFSGKRSEEGDVSRLAAFKKRIDALHEANDLDGISSMAHDFFAPLRYVLACLMELHPVKGLEVEWRSQIPIGGGLGSGAAAATSLVLGVLTSHNQAVERARIAELARNGDVIAHGGVASSLDSSTSAFGGMIQYTVASGAKPLVNAPDLPLVLIDTLVRANTATVNTNVRRYLSEATSRMHIFENVGYVVNRAIHSLEGGNLEELGNLMDLHQLLQEQMGTGFPEARRDIERAYDAGALGAKITGSGGGGIVIALCPPGSEEKVASSINNEGGVGVASQAGVSGVRLEDEKTWNGLTSMKLLDPEGESSFADAE